MSAYVRNIAVEILQEIEENDELPYYLPEVRKRKETQTLRMRKEESMQSKRKHTGKRKKAKQQ